MKPHKRVPANGYLLSQFSVKVLCKGCIKHECEIDGKKEILNPPESYVKGIPIGMVLEESHNPINVEDKADLRHMKKWCTKVPNRYGCFL